MTLVLILIDKYELVNNQIKSSLSLVSPSKEIVSGAPTTELVRTSDSPKSDVIKSSVRGKVKNGASHYPGNQ